jgi:hypothetical protein
MEVVEEARKEAATAREQARDAEMKRRKYIVAKVNYEIEKVDPFQIIKAPRPNPLTRDTSGPPSDAVIKWLNDWQIDPPDPLTMKSAMKLLLKEKGRREKGYASYRMCKWGLKYGYDLRKVKRELAKRLFEAVKAAGWKPLSANDAAAILLSREPGED